MIERKWNDNEKWKVYESYCVMCCRNKISPLSFETFCFLFLEESAEMPCCGECGRIVLDVAHQFCCSCGCRLSNA